MDLDLTEPTMDMLEEWALYESLDEQLDTFREEQDGPDWDGLQREYYNTTYGDERLQWRKDNPDEDKRLEAGGTMEKAFGKQHPAWLKYDDYEAWEGKEAAKNIAKETASKSKWASMNKLGKAGMVGNIVAAFMAQVGKGQDQKAQAPGHGSTPSAVHDLEEFIAGG